MSGFPLYLLLDLKIDLVKNKYYYSMIDKVLGIFCPIIVTLSVLSSLGSDLTENKKNDCGDY